MNFRRARAGAERRSLDARNLTQELAKCAGNVKSFFQSMSTPETNEAQMDTPPGVSGAGDYGVPPMTLGHTDEPMPEHVTVDQVADELIRTMDNLAEEVPGVHEAVANRLGRRTYPSQMHVGSMTLHPTCPTCGSADSTRLYGPCSTNPLKTHEFHADTEMKKLELERIRADKRWESER